MSDFLAKKRYLVILGDRKKAKLFTIYMGNFEEKAEEIEDKVPQKIKTDSRRGRVTNHIEEHVRQHLENVAKKAVKYLTNRKIKKLDGVILGGRKEFIPLIKEHLPTDLKSKVKAEITTELHLPTGDLTEIIKENLLD